MHARAHASIHACMHAAHAIVHTSGTCALAHVQTRTRNTRAHAHMSHATRPRNRAPIREDDIRCTSVAICAAVRLSKTTIAIASRRRYTRLTLAHAQYPPHVWYHPRGRTRVCTLTQHTRTVARVCTCTSTAFLSPQYKIEKRRLRAQAFYGVDGSRSRTRGALVACDIAHKPAETSRESRFREVYLWL